MVERVDNKLEKTAEQNNKLEKIAEELNSKLEKNAEQLNEIKQMLAKGTSYLFVAACIHYRKPTVSCRTTLHLSQATTSSFSFASSSHHRFSLPLPS